MEPLHKLFPPSEPCTCDICVGYCKRPGWWTVNEAQRALFEGFAFRMMVEISPDHKFAVLSPAFKGNEGNYALKIYSNQGCTFFHHGLCELYDTGFQPLECRYCHHTRAGLGAKCHAEIEKDWDSEAGRRLIVRWGNKTGFWGKQGLILQEK